MIWFLLSRLAISEARRMLFSYQSARQDNYPVPDKKIIWFFFASESKRSLLSRLAIKKASRTLFVHEIAGNNAPARICGICVALKTKDPSYSGWLLVKQGGCCSCINLRDNTVEKIEPKDAVKN